MIQAYESYMIATQTRIDSATNTFSLLYEFGNPPPPSDIFSNTKHIELEAQRVNPAHQSRQHPILLDFWITDRSAMFSHLSQDTPVLDRNCMPLQRCAYFQQELLQRKADRTEFEKQAQQELAMLPDMTTLSPMSNQNLLYHLVDFSIITSQLLQQDARQQSITQSNRVRQLLRCPFPDTVDVSCFTPEFKAKLLALHNAIIALIRNINPNPHLFLRELQTSFLTGSF